MSSDVGSALALQKVTDYGSLIVLTAVGYDFCLTFSREMVYVWNRPWTNVSTLFFIVRYVGALSVCMQALYGSTFIPGPMKVRLIDIFNHSPITHPTTVTENMLNDNRRTIINDLITWTLVIFLMAANMVLILRVYALYSLSRIILGVLLALYVIKIAILFIASGIYSDPKYGIVSIEQLSSDATVCNLAYSTQTWNYASAITQCILGTILFVMVVAHTVRNLVGMYRISRVWQLNKYMSLIFRDGMLYFLSTLLNYLITLLRIVGVLPSKGWVAQVLFLVANVPLFTLAPRFIIDIRELHLRDSQGRWSREMDSGLGLTYAAGRSAKASTTAETIAFLEATSSLEDGEEI